MEEGTRVLSLLGLILLTWNVEWTFNDLGRLRRTETGLMTFDMGNGPPNLGDNFLECT